MKWPTTAQGGLFSPHPTDVTSKSPMFMKFEAKIMDIVLCNPKLTISPEIMGSKAWIPKLFYDHMVGQKWWTIQSFKLKDFHFLR